MSESEIPEANPHGVYREEDELDDQNQEADITINSGIQQQVVTNVLTNDEPLTMDLVQQVLMNLQAQMAAVTSQISAVTTLFTRLPELVKEEVINLRPESVGDAEVQASILDKISEVSSKINSMEVQLASVEDLGQRTLHTYDKEIEVIKYDQNHLLHQMRCQSESAERESRRVHARFDALDQNLPRMVDGC